MYILLQRIVMTLIVVSLVACDNTSAPKTAPIQEYDSNANLSNLTISFGSLNEAFSADTLHYTAFVSSSTNEIQLIPETETDKSTININGEKVSSGSPSSLISLGIGKTSISIIVSSEKNIIQKIYNIIITRQADTSTGDGSELSNDSSLVNLELPGLNLDRAFDSDITNYHAIVDNNQLTLPILPTASHANATIYIGTSTISSGNTVDIPLDVGINSIIITVKAEDDLTQRWYNISVTREGSGNVNLSDVIISAGSFNPDFLTNVHDYTITVANTVGIISITPTVEDETTIVKINDNILNPGSAINLDLTVGSNTLPLTLVAQDGSTSTYTFNIIRATSGNVDLASLTLSSGGMDQTFDASVINYSQTLPSHTSELTITAITADPNSTLTINGTPVTSATSSPAQTLISGINNFEIIVNSSDSANTKTYNVVVTREASSNANLSSLVVSTGNLSPAFDPAISAYIQTVANTVNVTTVTPIVADSGATVTVKGVSVSATQTSIDVPLSIGDNIIPVVITSQAGNQHTYTLIIYKEHNNIGLSALSASIGALDQTFDPTITTYTKTVSSTTASTTITATPSNSNATVTINNVVVPSGQESGDIALNIGDNVVSVLILETDGTSKTYTILIQRVGNNNAGLSSLSASAGNFDTVFSTAITSYTMTVASDVNSTTITSTAIDTTSSININGVTVTSGQSSSTLPLSIGENTFSIIVTAQDATTKAYIISIQRAGSMNATLSALSASTGAFNETFNGDITLYTETVGNTVASTTITAIPNNASATVTINNVVVPSGQASGDIALSIGDNVVSILVLETDGTSKTYTVLIQRTGNNNAGLSSLSASEGNFDTVFNTAQTSYTMTVASNINSTTITSAAIAATSSIKINGVTVTSGQPSSALPLSIGENTFSIIVTAQDSTTKAYIINIQRTGNMNATLTALSTSTGVFNETFNSNSTFYTKAVGNSIASTTITAIPSNASATVTINNVVVSSGQASGNITLNIGDNVISVLVLETDGTSKVYNILIQRAADNNTGLSNLTISEGSLDTAFSTALTSYAVTVASNINSTIITPTAINATSSIKINGLTVTSGQPSSALPLSIGENTFSIIVTAQDATTKAYIIKVQRTGSTDATLSSLSTSTGIFNEAFNSSTTLYTQKVPLNITTITVTPVTNDINSTVKVNDILVPYGQVSGSINLTNNDSIINITVYAQNGNTKTYNIIVYRSIAGNANLDSLSVSTGALSPAFSPSTTAYTQSVNSSASSTDITANFADINATGMTINGQPATATTTINLNSGTNLITIIVTAEDNQTTKTYTITITRASAVSIDANLKGLTATTGFDPVFSSAVTGYSKTVDFQTNSVDLIATLNDLNASSLTINSETSISGVAKTVNLSPGLNVINVIVTAENVSVSKTYTLSITRNTASSALASLVPSVGELDQIFQGSVLNYNMTVSYLTSSIRVIPTVINTGNATITVNGQSVSDGSESQLITINEGANAGVVSILVTAVDTTTKTYTIDITRETLTTFSGKLRDYIKASNAITGNKLGSSVALSDIHLAVGANAGSKAYVYERTSLGSWSEQILSPTDNEATDFFGESIDIDGDTLIVGAPLEWGSIGGVDATHDNLKDASGAAYVYQKDASGIWVLQAKLKAPVGTLSKFDQFGKSVAISGNIVAVGAHSEDSNQQYITHGTTNSADNSASNSGAVYIFKRTNDVWKQEAYIKASDSVTNVFFGRSLAMDDDTLVVGAYKEDTSGIDSGAVYVYTRSSNGTWKEEQKIKESLPTAGARFGRSVDIHYNTLVIGAERESSDGPDTGKAFVYTRNASTWNIEATLSQTSVTDGDNFGQSVAIYNDTILIGVQLEDSDSRDVNGSKLDVSSTYDAGAAYLYMRSGTTWNEVAYIKANNRGGGDQFGTSVALDKGMAAIGAPFEDGSTTTINGPDDDNKTDAGASYIYE